MLAPTSPCSSAAAPASMSARTAVPTTLYCLPHLTQQVTETSTTQSVPHQASSIRVLAQILRFWGVAIAMLAGLAMDVTPMT